MIDQLWSGMLLFLSAAASNAGRQIWMKVIYIILHSLNSICKTSLVDMKLPVSVVLEWWSSIGRNLATVAVYNSVLMLADTSRDYHFLFFYNVTRIRIFLHGWARIFGSEGHTLSHSGNWPDCHVYDQVYMQSREVIFFSVLKKEFVIEIMRFCCPSYINRKCRLYLCRFFFFSSLAVEITECDWSGWQKGGFLSHMTLTFLKPSPITE